MRVWRRDHWSRSIRGRVVWGEHDSPPNNATIRPWPRDQRLNAPNNRSSGRQTQRRRHRRSGTGASANPDRQEHSGLCVTEHRRIDNNRQKEKSGARLRRGETQPGPGAVCTSRHAYGSMDRVSTGASSDIINSDDSGENPRPQHGRDGDALAPAPTSTSRRGRLRAGRQRPAPVADGSAPMRRPGSAPA